MSSVLTALTEHLIAERKKLKYKMKTGEGTTERKKGKNLTTKHQPLDGTQEDTILASLDFEALYPYSKAHKPVLAASRKHRGNSELGLRAEEDM